MLFVRNISCLLWESYETQNILCGQAADVVGVCVCARARARDTRGYNVS